MTRKDGEKAEYQLGPTGKEGYAVLKSSARPEYFRVPSYTADALIKAAGRTQLVQAAPAPAAARRGRCSRRSARRRAPSPEGEQQGAGGVGAGRS